MNNYFSISPFVGEPRNQQDIDFNEFQKRFQEGKLAFIKSTVLELTTNLVQGKEAENEYKSYYSALLFTFKDLKVPFESVVSFLSKHIDSRLKNINYVQLSSARYAIAEEINLFNHLCYKTGLNCMFKDFDSQEVKWITQAASKIVKTSFDKANVSEQTFQSPSRFRDLIINSIKTIRTQHASYLSFYDFELSKLNFILENEKVINWTKVLNDYGQKEVVK